MKEEKRLSMRHRFCTISYLVRLAPALSPDHLQLRYTTGPCYPTFRSRSPSTDRAIQELGEDAVSAKPTLASGGISIDRGLKQGRLWYWRGPYPLRVDVSVPTGFGGGTKMPRDADGDGGPFRSPRLLGKTSQDVSTEALLKAT